MQVEGRFIINPDTPDEEVIKNTITTDGAQYFLRTLFRGESVLPANFYIGLSNAAYSFTSDLTTMAAGEPSGNGYARQSAVRNTSDWDVSTVNGVWRARSKNCAFTASANWDKTWLRMFLASVVSGTSGQLFAVSGPAPAPRTVLLGLAPTVAYEFWMRA